MNSENENKEKKPLTLGAGKLSLKNVPMVPTTQNVHVGRQKTVMVEVRKKRSHATESSSTTGATSSRSSDSGSNMGLSGLTEGERIARIKAVRGAQLSDDEARRIAEANRLEEEAQKRKAFLEAQLEEEKRKRIEAQNAAKHDQELTASEGPTALSGDVTKPGTKPHVNQPTSYVGGRTSAKKAGDTEDEDENAARERAKKAVNKREYIRESEEKAWKSGRISVTDVLNNEDGGGRQRSLASVRRAREKERRKAQQSGQAEKIVREVIVPETITVQELSNRMAERVADVIKYLMKTGIIATINQSIDADTAELIVAEFGHKPKRVAESDIELDVYVVDDKPEDLMPRPPVVTIMGHVDHGKTSLLDALRSTDVAAGEAGGITQHIGAYQVQLSSGDRITFLDTPGHEAFTAMRARGAKVTDIVVLVVAADDGIQPQTIEAIHHAKAANVPIIVAVNKVDKPGANPERVRTDLLSHGLQVEDLGGDILAVNVSAKQRMNLDKLEEAIMLQGEILELRANPHCPAKGIVIESKMDKGRGVVTTVLVQRGTLKVGDLLIAGSELGRVRAMSNDRGQSVTQATPSTPVEVLGLQGIPLAGDEVLVIEDEARAKDIAEYRARKKREIKAIASQRGSVEQMFSKIVAGSARELPIVIKADVQGSVEAISNSLHKLSNEEVVVRILHSGVGGINEADVTLATASQGLIMGFNVRANPQARELAKRDNIEIRYYSIIYEMIQDVKALLSGLLSPTQQEEFLGYAEIREVFNVTKYGKIAGCRVTEGLIRRACKVRILRDNIVIHEGNLKSLRHFKEEVKEIKSGFECGIALENFQDIKPGDVLECFEIKEIQRSIA